MKNLKFVDHKIKSWINGPFAGTSTTVNIFYELNLSSLYKLNVQ